MCLSIHMFCTILFISTTQAHVQEIFHDIPWDSNNASASIQEYLPYGPYKLGEGCFVTYKVKKTCPDPEEDDEIRAFENSCPDSENFRPAQKTWLVAVCTEHNNCKRVKAQVTIAHISGEIIDRTKSETFTYVIGCLPDPPADNNSIFGNTSNALAILVLILLACNVFFMGTYFRTRHGDFCVSLASRLFPWRAGVYNPNSIAGPTVESQPSQVNNTNAGEYNPNITSGHSVVTQPSQGNSSSEEVYNTNRITGHSVLTERSQGNSTSEEVYNTNRIAGHSVLTEPSHGNSTIPGVNNPNSTVGHSMVTQPSQGNGTSAGVYNPNSMVGHSMETQPSQVNNTSAGVYSPNRIAGDTVETEPSQLNNTSAGVYNPNSTVGHSMETHDSQVANSSDTRQEDCGIRLTEL